MPDLRLESAMTKKWRKRKGLYAVLAMTVIVGAILIKTVIEIRTPVKYAIDLENIHKYPDSIPLSST